MKDNVKKKLINEITIKFEIQNKFKNNYRIAEHQEIKD